MSKFIINYGSQYIDSDDIRAVSNVLKSDWLTQGPQIEKFENNLKTYFNAKFCTVLSSGTAALHLAALALGWKKDDVIITTPMTFLATSNCILYCGATPVFVDIENKYYTIDVDKLEQKIKFFEKKKKRITGIIATDYAGHPCDWKSLRKIANHYGIKLINDNCHALGAQLDNDTGYATKYADIVTHSYHPVKNITAGEGGSILTNNKYLDQKIKSLRTHGIDNRKKKLWFYEMNDLGFNYRISDIHCALGISQLKKLNLFLKKRKEIAKIYDNFFEKLENFFVPQVKKANKHAYHLYPLRIDFKKFGMSKKLLFKYLIRRKINLQVHYIPIHLQPYYKKKFNFKKGDFPISEKFYDEEISMPIYFSLKKSKINYVVHSIINFFKRQS